MKITRNVCLALGLSAFLGLSTLTGCKAMNTPTVSESTPTTIQISDTVTKHMETESIFSDITEETIVTSIAVLDTEDASVAEDTVDTVVEIKENVIPEVTEAMERRSAEEILTEAVKQRLNEIYTTRTAVLNQYNIESFGESLEKGYQEGTLSEAERADYELKRNCIARVGVLTVGDVDYYIVIQQSGVDSVIAYFYMQDNTLDVAHFYDGSFILKTSKSEGTWEEALNNVKFFKRSDGSLLSYYEYVMYNGNISMALDSLETGNICQGTRDASGKCTLDYARISMEELPGSDETHLDLSSLTPVYSYFTWLS